ncbi:hypothetical protein FWF89_03320 [Candidatus Saccharibacteria bacterium]|nr:hypothetical protein [Candidatus Saccharibacteria bacterium]
MADQSALLKRVMRTQTVDVMHTSAHASAQNSGNFGAASTESFAQRRSVEEQRKFVRGYHNSKIMGSAGCVGRAKTYTPPPKTFGPRPGGAPTPGRPR